ncbi:uncharacterized protein M421DRAFT_5961 [Didymella exigua CBS 183.55]|uniref:Uncharacterized protein n=1 Tax=Didymella exigua CBS 183.55 TaxID=1150837 RepID=A0A6A5RH98_9PLEO|nr:uncharacterized protein M421DRAFT_5961 [Didymella exigua CBS 183.55]KAF1927695.1 hypothetical protein M421DRAFT_5961 [Didymella exigua CBS 183.55]
MRRNKEIWQVNECLRDMHSARGTYEHLPVDWNPFPPSINTPLTPISFLKNAMVQNTSGPRPKPFPMNVAQFVESLSGLSLEGEYEAQDDYIIHLLVRIITDRTEMQINSEECAQMSQARNMGPPVPANELDRLKEFAELQSIIARLFEELKVEVKRRWRLALESSFEDRMKAIEELRAHYGGILEVKRQGVQLVAKKASFRSENTNADSYGKDGTGYKDVEATNPAFYGRYCRLLFLSSNSQPITFSPFIHQPAMCLLGITKINKKLSTDIKKNLDDLHTKLAAEDAFEQPVIDEICSTVAWCRTVLNDAIDEIAAEKQRLAKDVFADSIIHDVFSTIRGDETSFPQCMYDNHDAISASYCAGQRALYAFEQDMRKEWEEISKMAAFERKDFVLLARRKIMSTITELEKTREKDVQESKKLEEEIKTLQGVLRVQGELDDATEEFYDAEEFQ